MALRDQDKTVQDLYKINLLSKKQQKVINNIRLLSLTISETILNGDKNDFFKFTTYLESHLSIKYLVQYWKKICELSVTDVLLSLLLIPLAADVIQKSCDDITLGASL